MNNRYGRGLILAITTPKSLKVQGKEIYYVQSERDERVRYRGNVTQSFNDVIQSLIQKTATGQQPFQGTAGQAAGRFNPEAEGR